MSLYNEILTGRFNRALQKFFGIKGGPPAPQLTSEISVAVNLFWGAECRYLESWNRFGAGFDVAAVAANSGAVRMRNPAASAVVAVFEKISIACVTAAGLFDMQNGPSTTDLATGLGNFAGARLDPRGVGTPTVIGSFSNTVVTPPALGSLTNRVAILQNTTLDLIWAESQEIPLLPGDAIEIQCDTVNNRMIVNFIWRERSLEEGERF